MVWCFMFVCFVQCGLIFGGANFGLFLFWVTVIDLSWVDGNYVGFVLFCVDCGFLICGCVCLLCGFPKVLFCLTCFVCFTLVLGSVLIFGFGLGFDL